MIKITSLFRAVTFGGLFVFSLALANKAHAEIKLKFGVYTADKASDIVKQVTPVLSYLETAVSQKLRDSVSIELVVAPSYEEGTNAIVDGKVDFAQLGPVSYVLAKEKNSGLQLLAIETEKGQKEFPGYIIVSGDSPLKALTELKGKRFAFGDELSTTGRYLPQQLLLANGIKAKGLGHYEYLGRHDKVGAAVASKEFDAGAINKRGFNKLVEAGSSLKVLSTFSSVTKPWVASSKLNPKTIAAISEALIACKDAAVLEALKQDGFAAAFDSDFAPTREAVSVNQKFFE